MFRRRSYGRAMPRRTFAPRRTYRAAAPRRSYGPVRTYGYRPRGYSARSGYSARRLYIGGRRY